MISPVYYNNLYIEYSIYIEKCYSIVRIGSKSIVIAIK